LAEVTNAVQCLVIEYYIVPSNDNITEETAFKTK